MQTLESFFHLSFRFSINQLEFSQNDYVLFETCLVFSVEFVENLKQALSDRIIGYSRLCCHYFRLITARVVLWFSLRLMIIPCRQ